MRQSNSLKNFPTKTFDNKPFKSMFHGQTLWMERKPILSPEILGTFVTDQLIKTSDDCIFFYLV